MKNKEKRSFQYNQEEEEWSENKKYLLDSEFRKYENLSISDLVKLMKSKDKTIQSLQQEIRNNSKVGYGKFQMYRKKLEQEIVHNQKAVKAFEKVTQIIVDILKKYQEIDQATRQSVNSIVGLRQNVKNFEFNEEEGEDQSKQSEFSCISEIVNQITRLLDCLSKLTDQNVSLAIKQKGQIIRLRSQSRQNTEIRKNFPNCGQNGRQLAEEMQKLMLQNKNLSTLLEKNEVQKMELMRSIDTNVSEKEIRQLNKLSGIELIEYIKKLLFRIKRLEEQKKNLWDQIKLTKEESQKQYENLLMQVKKIKHKKPTSLSSQ